MTPDQWFALLGNGLVQAFGGFVAFSALYMTVIIIFKIREDKRQRRMDNKLTRIQGLLIIMYHKQQNEVAAYGTTENPEKMA